MEPYLKQFRFRCIKGFWLVGIAVEFCTVCDKIVDQHIYTNCSGKAGFLFFTLHFMFPVTKWKRRKTNDH